MYSEVIQLYMSMYLLFFPMFFKYRLDFLVYKGVALNAKL